MKVARLVAHGLTLTDLRSNGLTLAARKSRFEYGVGSVNSRRIGRWDVSTATESELMAILTYLKMMIDKAVILVTGT